MIRRRNISRVPFFDASKLGRMWNLTLIAGLIATACLFFTPSAQAARPTVPIAMPTPRLSAPAPQFNHQLMRRMVVFPMRTDPTLQQAADDAWWQAREELTRSRRFLVASKQFLIKSDVFKPRGELEPADSIILGKLLDAHGLITLQLNERRLQLNTYDSNNGVLLWTKSVPLHPSLAVTDQLPVLAKKIMADFVSAIPYQGFTIVDSLIGRPLYEEGSAKLAQVDLGITTGAQLGDLVQWVKLGTANAAPLFQGGADLSVFAEGKIVRLEQGIATVEVTRAVSPRNIVEYSLVRVPREAERLVAANTISEAPKTTLSAELVSPESGPMEQLARERKPLTTTLSFVGSIAAFLLLAF